MAVLNCSVGSADLWQEGFVLGGVLQTFGQQHFSMCSGQLPLASAGFELALSRRPQSVAPKLKATNTTAATKILKIRCIADMLKPEARRSKTFLLSLATLDFPAQISAALITSILGLSQLRLVAGTLDDWKPRVFRELWITG